MDASRHRGPALWSLSRALLVLLIVVERAAAFPSVPTPVPAPNRFFVKRANPTDVWVSVDGDGKPKTITPVPTAVSGTPTILSGAPNDITATVFTTTFFGEVSTRTGTTPLAGPTAGNGAGAFARCFNKEGEIKPFCAPGKNDTVIVGSSYYVTWDPDFFNSNNHTADRVEVKIAAFKMNSTTFTKMGDRIDLSPPIRGSLGFFTWYADPGLLDGQATANLSLVMLWSLTVGGTGAVPELRGPTVVLSRPPTYQPKPTKLPEGAALYIGLPTIFGFIILGVIGGCLWNRKTRQIGLGNIMSRTRHGYGIGESRRERIARGLRRSLWRGRKDNGIQLVDREIAPEQVYRDIPAAREPPTDVPGERFQNQTVGGGRNVFREEMQRQERERH